MQDNEAVGLSCKKDVTFGAKNVSCSTDTLWVSVPFGDDESHIVVRDLVERAT